MNPDKPIIPKTCCPGFSIDQLALYLDPTAILQGWPGHRHRPDRSGYDPVDTYTEYGHLQGVFFRHLFTGKLRTSNPVYLFLMGAGGLYALFPLVFILGNCGPTSVGCLFVFLAIFSPYHSVGLALLINLYINIKACSNSPSKHLDFE